MLDETSGCVYSLSLTNTSITVLDAKDIFNSGLGTLRPLATIPIVNQPLLSSSIRRGKQIFYNAGDSRMTRQESNTTNTGYFACADCHFEGGHDGMTWNFTDRGEGVRNTTSLLGGRGDEGGMLHWTGNFDEVQDFEHDIRGAFGGTGFLSDQQFNSNNRNAPLGNPKAGLNPDLDNLAEYVRSLRELPRSPFKAAAGTYSDQARQGARLISALNCTKCHSGVIFSDSSSGIRHDVGTITQASGKRLNGPLDGFDTPTLSGLFGSAPYLHDGSAATLDTVLTTARAGSLHDLTSKVLKGHRDMIVALLKELDASESENDQTVINQLSSTASGFDLDDDLMDDTSELQFFGSLGRDGRDDFDRDGFSDQQELASGTNPLDASSKPGSIIPTPGVAPTAMPTLTPASGPSCVYEYLSPRGNVPIWDTGFAASLKVSVFPKADLGKNWRLSFDLPSGVKGSWVNSVWNVSYTVNNTTISAGYTKTGSGESEWFNGSAGTIYTGYSVNGVKSSLETKRLSVLPVTRVILNGMDCAPAGVNLRFDESVRLSNGNVRLGTI